MGQMDIKEIEAGLKDWEFLRRLPQQIGEFKLVGGTGISGQILNIAAYVHETSHCRLDLTYTTETFDYVPVKTVGLHTFRDVRFFCRNREHFAEQMLQKLPEILGSIDRKSAHKMPFEAKALGFGQWDYWKSLPQQIAGYELYITPENPLPFINGSVIFLDYTDFLHGNQIYFSYNIFRNELFAEMRKNHLPLTTEAFDVKSNVPDARKLEALQVHLEEKLQSTLESLKN